MAEFPDDLRPLPTAPWAERPTELPLDIEECRTALWLCRGNITKAAEMLKVNSGRLRAFVKNSEYLRNEVEEAKEQLLDHAEVNIYEAITDSTDAGRRDSMSRFVMERLGKHRGYGSGNSALPMNGPKGRIVVTWDSGEDAPTKEIDGTFREAAE